MDRAADAAAFQHVEEGTVSDTAPGWCRHWPHRTAHPLRVTQ